MSVSIPALITSGSQDIAQGGHMLFLVFFS